MGILFVLFFWAIALSIVAAISAAILGGITFLITRRALSGRRRAVIATALFPFACVAYAGVWFVAYAVINTAVFQRDPGLGDSWKTPLPNGYALMMIDVTDEGTVYNPKTQHDFDIVIGQSDTEFGVRKLQLAGPHIFGARDSDYFVHIGQNSTAVDTWFDLDTRTGSIVEFKSLDALQQRAATEGAILNLRDFYDIYTDFRFTWFDFTAFVILLLIPALAFISLAFWVWKIRKRGLSNTLEKA